MRQSVEIPVQLFKKLVQASEVSTICTTPLKIIWFQSTPLCCESCARPGANIWPVRLAPSWT